MTANRQPGDPPPVVQIPCGSQAGVGKPAGGSGGSTSRSLLAEARLADPAAWERLVKLYAAGRLLVPARGVAEQDVVDVLQEVFSAVAGHWAVSARSGKPTRFADGC